MAIYKLQWEDKKGYDSNKLTGQLYDVASYTVPAIDGDEFLVYFNDENQQACVYWKLFNGGARICLEQHIDLVMNLLDGKCYDQLFYDEIKQLAAAKADAAGFPRTWHEIPHELTWRELIDQLNRHPELLDEVAYVWTPVDSTVYYDDFSTIYGIEPFDSDNKASTDNPLSITLNIR